MTLPTPVTIPAEPIHIISLGAGVQSSTMALMASEGDITPMPAFAVFADTGDEPEEVYRWLTWLERTLRFPVHRVQSHHGKLSDNLLKGNFSQIPAWMLGEKGKPTIGKRQCTNHWKLRPINKAIREITGTKRKRLPVGYFTVWKGISVDEIERVKPSTEKCQTARFPLIEMDMRREHCVDWLKMMGVSAPKSACVFCPYRSDAQWAASKKKGGAEWEKIVAVDTMLANRGYEYLHKSGVRIQDAVFVSNTTGEFSNECEGMCGV